MTKQSFTPAYPTELRERGVRLFRENRGDYASDTAAFKAIAPKLGDDAGRIRSELAEMYGRIAQGGRATIHKG